jgi:hypothetical protein
MTVSAARRVPIIGVSFTVSLSLYSQVLIFKKRHRITQLKSGSKRRHRRFSGDIQLLVYIMATICL